MKGRKLFLWIVVPVMVLICALFLWPDRVGWTKEHAKQTQTLINITILASRVLAWENRAGGEHRLPPDMTSMVSLPREIDVGTITSLNKGSELILGNSGLKGKRIDDITDPRHTIMFYDSAPWPDGKRAVAFVDGHARLLDEKEFQDALENKWVLAK